MSIHDKPTLTAMLAPGRRALGLQRAAYEEIARIDERIAALSSMTPRSALAVSLAREQMTRLNVRHALLKARNPNIGRPSKQPYAGRE